jgi:hypothetical protein
LLSKLDDSIWHGRYTNETLPESCANLFGEVDILYEFIVNSGTDIEKVSVSDIGSINLVEQIPTKSKLIKVAAELHPQKVMEQDALTHFYLRIIKQWESDSFPKASLPNAKNVPNNARSSNVIVR